MINVGVTGSEGFIGWHLITFLNLDEDINVIKCDRKSFNDDSLFKDFINKSDVIVHLAGQNRGNNDEIYHTNVELTERLIEFCLSENWRKHIIFSSSIHVNRNTSYGESKKESGKLFKNWAEENDAIFSNLIIPNVYGEFQKPNYNSVVATFCSQIVSGKESQINVDAELEMIHVSQLVAKIKEQISSPSVSVDRFEGETITVSDLYKKLETMWVKYSSEVLPDLSNQFDCLLFNTLRSYILNNDYFPKTYILKEDQRGVLFELFKVNSTGQGFISWTKPGVTRGGHFHTRKFERFAVVKGEAEIVIEKIRDNNPIKFTISGSDPSYVDMPTFYSHTITNIGIGELIVLFWTNEIFNPEDADTFQVDK